MNPLSIFWLALFGITALLFFGVAVIVAVKGFQDLRELLFHREEKKNV